MALHQMAHAPLSPKSAIKGWFNVRQAAVKTALLTGLLLTGLVDEDAIANSRYSADEANVDVTHFQGPPALARPTQLAPLGPAMVELHIEGAETSITHTLYFPPDSIDLTPEARLALTEITDEISLLENPSVSLSSQDGDRLLSFERINTVAGELERSGFDKARLFTWSELDILTAREL